MNSGVTLHNESMLLINFDMSGLEYSYTKTVVDPVISFIVNTLLYSSSKPQGNSPRLRDAFGFRGIVQSSKEGMGGLLCTKSRFFCKREVLPFPKQTFNVERIVGPYGGRGDYRVEVD